MRNLIITLTSTTLLTIATLTQADSAREQHFTRDYACKVLESTRRQIETELRNNLNVGMPRLQIDAAGTFSVDDSTAQVETHASNSSSTSLR